MIRTKRAYAEAEALDGRRFLVDHLWPRGVKKTALQVEHWPKEVAPSNQLRKWFGHAPVKWAEFKKRYFAELEQKPEAWQELLAASRAGDITLVFGARDTQHNNAVALKEFLESRAKRQKGPASHRKLSKALSA